MPRGVFRAIKLTVINYADGAAYLPKYHYKEIHISFYGGLPKAPFATITEIGANDR